MKEPSKFSLSLALLSLCPVQDHSMHRYLCFVSQIFNFYDPIGSISVEMFCESAIDCKSQKCTGHHHDWSLCNDLKQTEICKC